MTSRKRGNEMIAPKPTPVAIATIMRPEGYTGVQTHTRVLHAGIAQAGFPCSVLTPFSGSKWKWFPVFAVRPILLYRLNKNWSTRWYRHWHFIALRENLLRHLSGNPVKTLIAQCPLSALAALQVRERLGGDLKIALVCHFSGSQAEEFRGKGELNDEVTVKKIWDLEKQVIRSVDVVIHNSDWQRSTLEGCHGIRPKSSTVIWNGIPATVPDRSVSRRDLGLSPDDLILINVGSLEPVKKQLGLLDLFAEVSTRYSHAKLLLVGGGPQRSAIQQKIERHGLDSKVRLLGARPDVPAILRTADVYIHYATRESFGIVLLEAARAGLPLAAVPAGGVSEVLSRLQGGVALHANDPQASLEALRPLLEDPALRADMGRRARHNFGQSFTCEVMIGNYLRELGLVPGNHIGIQGGGP
jgi:glycosyltransferase involved in cell wall biosynthesis